MPPRFEVLYLFHDHLHPTSDVVVGDEVGNSKRLPIWYTGCCTCIRPDPIYLHSHMKILAMDEGSQRGLDAVRNLKNSAEADIPCRHAMGAAQPHFHGTNMHFHGEEVAGQPCFVFRGWSPEASQPEMK